MMTHLLKWLRIRIDVREEVLIALVAIVAGVATTYYVKSLGLLMVYADQNSHLNIARLITDSLTPGISQIGFWPPLLHVLMAPFAMIQPLFESGLAGAMLLVPALAVGAIFLYRLLLLLTEKKLLSFLGAMLFLLNPYLLYYAVTPMTEVLFITFLMVVAYFVADWLKTERFSSLMLLSICIMLATLTRFEGFILLPIVGLVVLVKLVMARKPYQEIEAILILFSLIAVVGVVLVLLYGIVFGDHPLAFMNGAWSAYEQQRDYFLPTERSLSVSFLYLVQAAYHMLGKISVILASLSLAFLLFFLQEKERYVSFFAVAAVLASPFFFDMLALYQGSAIVHVPDLPPYAQFFNARYALLVLGFVIVTPLMLVSVLYDRASLVRGAWSGVFVGGAVLGMLFVGNGELLHRVVYQESFSSIVHERQVTPAIAQAQREFATVLRLHYDGGKILMTRANHDFLVTAADLPLRRYIIESNYQYYDRTLAAPWFYARFVVMFDDETPAPNWAKRNERVSVLWAGSPEFERYYELVFENNHDRLYRLREGAVREEALRQGILLSRVPSLNPTMEVSPDLFLTKPRDPEREFDRIPRDEEIVINRKHNTL